MFLSKIRRSVRGGVGRGTDLQHIPEDGGQVGSGRPGIRLHRTQVQEHI